MRWARGTLRKSDWHVVSLAAVPVAAMLALRVTPWSRWIFQSVSFHMVVVSAIAGCAVVVAIGAAMAAARTKETGLVFLALGCEFVGAFMLGHGLTTPGVLDRPFNLWVGRFPVLAMTMFALCLLAAATGGRRTWLRWVGEHATAVLVSTGATLLLLTTVVVTNPHSLGGGTPFGAEEDLRLVLTVVNAGLLAVTGLRHWRRWQLSTDPVQAALFGANILCACAVVAFETGTVWHLAWWDYHGYLLAGFAGAAWAVLVGYRRSSTVHEVMGLIYEDDALVQIAHGYPEALRALVVAVEVKDSYTHGHSARVAELAVRLGARMGMPPHDLRILAQGGYLHDIGKIGIADAILNKPGPLTPDERTVIETHPDAGCRIAGEVTALSQALTVIRHHHERWDGGGYPAGLANERIPLVARVAAVADVWDALTSDRSYRDAWPPEEALAHLKAASGTHFDPRCVAAFELLVAEWGVVAAEHGDEAVAVGAANAPCPP